MPRASREHTRERAGGRVQELRFYAQGGGTAVTEQTGSHMSKVHFAREDMARW